MILGYIDINLGSMALQAFAGLIFSGVVMGRHILAHSFRWFSSNEAQQDSSSEPVA